MTSCGVSPLDAHLGYWLRFVSNRVSHSFSLKLQSHGVTVAEWVVLRQLYDQDAIAPSELADRIGMTRGAVSKLADRLISKSLIRRSISKDDRRCQSLMLSPSGQALVPTLGAAADRNDAEFFGHLEHRERKHVENVMKEIVRRCELCG
jgi:DNA-binding MarR family transcriptional regulator